MVLLVFSLVAMSEAFRLIISKDPHVLYDPLGPGFYILFLSLGLFAAAIVHVAVNYKKSAQSQKTTEPGSGARVLFSVGAMILYILLVRIRELSGRHSYLLSSPILDCRCQILAHQHNSECRVYHGLLRCFRKVVWNSLPDRTVILGGARGIWT